MVSLNMSNISSLQGLLKDITKSNFNISCMLSSNSDEIHIRVHNLLNNTYRVHSFSQHFMYHASQGVITRSIIQQLVLHDDCIIGFGPMYLKNFAILMDQIWCNEYTPGKLY